MVEVRSWPVVVVFVLSAAVAIALLLADDPPQSPVEEAAPAPPPCSEAAPDERCVPDEAEPRPPRPARGAAIVAGCAEPGRLAFDASGRADADPAACRAFFDYLPAKYEIWQRQRGTDAAAACLYLNVMYGNRDRACGGT